MMLCDVVGRLFQGVCKKGAVHHGLFLLGPPEDITLARGKYDTLFPAGKVMA